MNFFQALILGVVQGATEFLPVSSSAHLALVPYWLNWQLDPEIVFLFGVLVQMGTLAAVIMYFWRDLWKIAAAMIRALCRGKPFDDSDAYLGWMIILGTIPAGIVGLILKPFVESAFDNPREIAVFLWGTAIILTLSDRLKRKERTLEKLDVLDALAIGLGQALAIFPGISRSGATIAAAMTRRFTRDAASRFSFLLSIPIMTLAGSLSVLNLDHFALLKSVAPELLAATILAALTGFFAIRWLLGYIAKKPFTIFSIYCAIVGTLTFVLTWFR